jgi:hypothetical protein
MKRAILAAAVAAVVAIGTSSLMAAPANAAPDCNHINSAGDTSGLTALCNSGCQLTGACSPNNGQGTAGTEPQALQPGLPSPAVGPAPQPNDLPAPAIGTPTGPANPMPGAAPGYAVDPNAPQNVLTGGPCGGPSDPLCVAPPIDPHAPPSLPTAARQPGE